MNKLKTVHVTEGDALTRFRECLASEEAPHHSISLKARSAMLKRHAGRVVRTFAVVVILGSRTWAGFPDTTWGMPIQGIQAAYPGGFVEHIDDNEVHYTVAKGSFDQQSSLITFCIRGTDGLQFVIVDISKPDSTPKLETRAYDRLDVAAALAAHERMKALFTDLYGKPRYSKGSFDTGCNDIWNAEDGSVGLDVARIRAGSLPTGELSSRLSLWFSSDARLTDRDQLLRSGLLKVPESEWFGAGQFDVKWGMGPGDVFAVYPQLSGFLASSSEPTQRYSCDEYVNGNVSMHFDFFEGQLTELVLLYIGDSRDGSPKRTEEERKQFWAAAEYWRTTICNTLEDKYGHPIVAPTAEELLAGDRSKFHWIWSAGVTGIHVAHELGIPALQYVNLLAIDRVEQAKAEYARAAKEEHKRRF